MRIPESSRAPFWGSRLPFTRISNDSAVFASRPFLGKIYFLQRSAAKSLERTDFRHTVIDAIAK